MQKHKQQRNCGACVFYARCSSNPAAWGDAVGVAASGIRCTFCGEFAVTGSLGPLSRAMVTPSEYVMVKGSHCNWYCKNIDWVAGWCGRCYCDVIPEDFFFMAPPEYYQRFAHALNDIELFYPNNGCRQLLRKFIEALSSSYAVDSRLKLNKKCDLVSEVCTKELCDVAISEYMKGISGGLIKSGQGSAAVRVATAADMRAIDETICNDNSNIGKYFGKLLTLFDESTDDVTDAYDAKLPKK